MGGSMTKIIPRLYLGSVRNAEDEQELTLNGITHILTIHDLNKELVRSQLIKFKREDMAAKELQRLVDKFGAWEGVDKDLALLDAGFASFEHFVHKGVYLPDDESIYPLDCDIDQLAKTAVSSMTFNGGNGEASISSLRQRASADDVTTNRSSGSSAGVSFIIPHCQYRDIPDNTLWKELNSDKPDHPRRTRSGVASSTSDHVLVLNNESDLPTPEVNYERVYCVSELTSKKCD